VYTAGGGEEALKQVAEVRPDVILLDVMMPDIDGFQLCKQIKEIDAGRETPIIFISARSDMNDKLRAFEAGGVDYITKPFQVQEVLVRVKTHLHFRRLQLQLQQSNNELERRVEARTAELLAANVTLTEEITERHRIEESLRKSEETYRTLFEDSRDTIFIMTPSGHIVDMNSAGLDLLGYQREDLSYIQAVDLYVNATDYSHYRHRLETRGVVKDFEVKLKRQDGTHMDCLITANVRRDYQGEIIEYQGVIRDITDRKQMERERLLLLSIQRELGIAQEIQESLLPAPEPDWPDLELICYNTPAREMGGDLYDYHAFNHVTGQRQSLFQPRSKYVVMVGDVSGKGVPAALLMAISLASFRSIITEALGPSDFLRRMDRVLADYTHRSHQNCAMVYLEIMPPFEHQAGILRTANAGCVTPLLKRVDGTTEWIEVGGMPLGVGLGAQTGYKEITLTLDPGDMIILTSDGIVEANNEAGKMLGFERLEAAVQAGPQSSAEDMLEYLIEAMAEFVGETEPHDDITIVVVRV
jgi:PAS domain S-box-containing protein